MPLFGVLGQTPKVEDFFEDVILAMRYYSMPVLCEMSNDSLLKLIKDRGYRHFSMNNPFKNAKDLSPTEKMFGGASQNSEQIQQQQFYAVEAYIEDYVGYATSDDIRPEGSIGYMPFNEVLEQWKRVDLGKRTKYDAYISTSLALIANQRTYVAPKLTKKRRVRLQRYYNGGTISKAI